MTWSPTLAFAPGDWAYTLTLTDICTGWTDLVAVMGKGQRGVLLALDQIRQRLPFTLAGIHTDNGSEFLNAHLIRYCRTHHIAFTRGRPNYKNDNPHVEQKNGSLVRRFAGYHRFDTPELVLWLQDLYDDLCPYANLFLPVMKLVGRAEVGGRTRKRYDRPATPPQPGPCLGRLQPRSAGHRTRSVCPAQPAHHQAPHRPPHRRPTPDPEARHQCLAATTAADPSWYELVLTERLGLGQLPF
ncbi:MAG TPA: hypothetical protein VIN56_06745 [Candidatus Dormibacteraeota bacterium]